jgi:hypothetical protein
MRRSFAASCTRISTAREYTLLEPWNLPLARRFILSNTENPLERHFSSKVCRDIGAIWSVKVQVFRDSRYLSRVVCSGSVDESVHGPWLAVRNYLDGLPGSVSRSEALSSRWRSSPEFGRFASLVRSAELSFYSPSADEGSCIRPTTVEPLKRTRLIAHCSIELHGKLVDLVFDVVRNTRTAKWEIDATQIK